MIDLNNFKIEQIAFAAKDPAAVIRRYEDIGLDEWQYDHVVASGTVFGAKAENEADLAFNYQLGYELEILKYTAGYNWHLHRPEPPSTDIFLSHQGMHVDHTEMLAFKRMMEGFEIQIAQELYTKSHTNPHIKDERRYHYVVFDSHKHFGFDLKLIERLNLDMTPFNL